MKWKKKAHTIIAELCFAAWREANPPGRRKHKPYAVPAFAAALVSAMALPCEAEQEKECKRLFHLYEFGADSMI